MRAEAKFVAGALLLSFVLLAGGCGARGGAESPSGKNAAAVEASRSRSVAESMRPFFVAGLAFVVVGGLLAGFGGRSAGGMLLTLGGATTAVGVLFVRYPWTVLILALLAAAVAGYAAWDRIRTARELARSRDALAETAEVIQNLPEGGAIKRGLRDLGRDVEECVREAVDPIKKRLRREGKISP